MAQRVEHWSEEGKKQAPPVAASASSGQQADASASSSPTQALEQEQKKPFVTDLARLGVFFTFGTVISGPIYHYWFNSLNELPLRLWNLKNVRHRGKILQSYAYLKAHGIEVKLDLAKLPNAKELSRFTVKVSKILADQLLFSSAYTVVLFMCLGLMNGAVDRHWLQKSGRPIEEFPDLVEKYKSHGEGRAFCEMLKLREELAMKVLIEKAGDEKTAQSLQQEKLLLDLLSKLDRMSGDSACHRLNWSDIWEASWHKTKSVFLGVYMVDCAVWPLLQLVNFSFVPLRFQVLYVNVCNLAWNTFISVVQNNQSSLSFLKFLSNGGH